MKKAQPPLIAELDLGDTNDSTATHRKFTKALPHLRFESPCCEESFVERGGHKKWPATYLAVQAAIQKILGNFQLSANCGRADFAISLENQSGLDEKSPQEAEASS